MSADLTDAEDRILAALEETVPDNCPVRDGHAAMVAQCAICGTEPPVVPEPHHPSPLQEQLSALSSRPTPGSFWWDYQIGQALRARNADRLTYLIEMAERNSA